MSTEALNVYIDGAARGNPGPAAFAFVMVDDGKLLIEEAGCLGRQTNNVAEYTALVRALEHAAKLDARRLLIHSDSELLVKQMNGVYRVKNPDLQVLYEEAKGLCRKFDAVTIRHVRREQNSQADRLCNEALDGRSASSPPPARSKPVAVEREDSVRADALDCLRTAALAWSRGDAGQPPIEAVWDQLWSILEEHGVVRSARRR